MGDFLDDAITVGSLGLIDGGDVTGSNQADAARAAAARQEALGREGIEFRRESRDLARQDLAPFREFGQTAIDPLQELLTPEGQVQYLQNNPIFDAALDRVNQATLNRQSARGKLGSGGTLEALQNNFLATGQSFIQPQINNLMSALNTGQASAAGQANLTQQTGGQIANQLGQIGDVQAAGIVGAQNARTNAFNQLLNVGGRVAGSYFGGGI